MNTYGNWGFKRPERLDVKKPGPAYNTNNYAFVRENNKSEKINEGKQTNKQTNEFLMILITVIWVLFIRTTTKLF